MKRWFVLAAAAVAGAAVSSAVLPTGPAYARRFKARVEFGISGADFGPEGHIPAPPATLKGRFGGFSGGSVNDVPYWFAGGERTISNIRHIFSFGLPDIDWSTQELPFTFSTLSCTLGVDELNGGVPDILGYWSRNPQGASAMVTVTDYAARSRRIRGTIDATLLDALLARDLAPVTVTAEFDLKLPR